MKTWPAKDNNDRNSVKSWLRSVWLGLDPDRKSNWLSISRNISWLFLEKAIRALAGLIVGAWLARHLGPQGYGTLAYAIAFVAIFQSALPLGIDNIAVRDMARSPENSPRVLGTAFVLRLASSVILYIATFVAIIAIKPDDNTTLTLVLIIAGVMALQPIEIADLWFQSKIQSRWTVKAKLFALALSTALRIYFIVTTQPLVAFAWVIFFDGILFSTALAFAYKSQPDRPILAFDIMLAKQMLKEGIFPLTSGILLTAYLQIDKLWIGNLIGAKELGIYVAAATPVAIFSFLPMIVCSSLAPRMANIDGAAPRRAFFTGLVAALFWSATSISFVLFAFSEAIIEVLYGNSFSSSSELLRLLSPLVVFIFLSVANDYYSLIIQKTQVTFYRTVAGLAINVLLNYFLIPKLGAFGAVISSLIAHAVSNTIVYWALVPGSLAILMNAMALPAKIFIREGSKT